MAIKATDLSPCLDWAMGLDCRGLLLQLLVYLDLQEVYQWFIGILTESRDTKTVQLNLENYTIY